MRSGWSNGPNLTTSACACGILLAAILGHAPAHAAWEFVPDLGIRAYSEKNPRLRPDLLVSDDTTETSGVFDVAATIATYGEQGFLSFEPGLTAYRYVDQSNSDLESEDLFLDGAGEYRWQTAAAGFASSISRERLLSSELADVEPDDPDTEDREDIDTGRLLLISENRDRIRLSPYVDFEVSERNTLRLRATSLDVSYSGGDLSTRTGYHDLLVSAGIFRNVDERNSVAAIMSVESYEADVNQNATDNVTIEGTFTRPVTELWTFNLAAGVLRSDFDYLEGNQRVNGATTDYTMRVGFRKRTERSRIDISLSRNTYPSSSGFSSVRREFRLYLDRAVTQRLNARFGVRMNETKSLDDVSERDNRDFARAELGFSWALKPAIFLDAGYRYTAQEFTNSLGEESDSQAIFIGMNYRGMSRR